MTERGRPPSRYKELPEATELWEEAGQLSSPKAQLPVGGKELDTEASAETRAPSLSQSKEPGR